MINKLSIDYPIDLYISWGTCINYAKILWKENILYKNSTTPFKNYIRYMDETVGFHCVIMGRFKWGLLCIDMCDASDWEIENIDEPHYYLKMQYNLNYKYKNNTIPFTYMVADPLSFEYNLANYQELYKSTYHANLVYGRWLAASLSRYNIAKKMRELGILFGGEYCMCPKGKGYDDHEQLGLLDYNKPREKILWDEYFKYQCISKSVLDAPGFGDITHRTIESFGIGIPVIRPKLKNITYNPIEPNTHYLDCGENGEYLRDCLDMIQKDNISNTLIQNAFLWYQNNASIVSFKTLILKIINKL
jgi:hypothetical protein